MLMAEEETRVAARAGRGDAEIRVGQEGENHPGLRPPLLRKEGSLDEAEIFSISPTLVFVKVGYVAAAVGALFLVAVVSVVFGAGVPTWVAVLLGLMLFLIPGFYHFKRKLVKYTLTDSKLEIDTGLISRTTRNIPIGRIQDVTVSANVMQRLIGFGDVVIDNASDLGGKAVLKNINSPKQYADVLLKQMRALDR